MNRPDEIPPGTKKRRSGGKRPRPATLSDVAYLAGVSSGTASSILNGSRSNTRVSDATRLRILTAAAELDYHPCWAGRSLRKKRSGVIGYYGSAQMVEMHSWAAAELAIGLHEGCREHHRDLLLHGAFSGEDVGGIHDGIMNGKTDGLVLWTSPQDALVPRIAASYLPVVLVADTAVPRLPSVVADDSVGPQLLAEHLAARGHRRVLYRITYQSQAGSHRRLRAFIKAAALYGVTVKIHTGATGWLSEEEKAILARPRTARPTAVVCWCDSWVRSAVFECLSLGLRVPEDIAVVGFDGLPGMAEAPERQTTVAIPWREMAHTAVSLLVSKIDGERVPRKTVVPVALEVGATS
jgi:DNA-binding LacI/PurR family transcriptional regulator